MKNYTLLISLLVLLLIPFLASSQKNNHNSQKSNNNSNTVESIEKQMVKIQEKLGLDGLQDAVVQNILEKYSKKKKQLRNQSEDRKVMSAKMQDLNLEQNQELSEILTEEQMADFQKIFKEQRSQNNPQSKKGNGSGSGKRKGKGLRRF